MALSKLLFTCLWLCFLFAKAVIALTQANSESRCPITRVDSYKFSCARQGWIRDPVLIKTVSAKSTEDCAKQCLGLADCKTFRVVELKHDYDCYLYSQILSRMSFDDQNFIPGVTYDRNCFSTDCNTIKACHALPKKCQYTQDHSDQKEWEQRAYACAYGLTARIYNLKYKEVKLPGNLTACEARDSCGIGGVASFDVHYHIPSKKWICRRFPVIKYHEYGIREQKIDETRYSVRNAGVGAGYGFYLFESFVDD